VALDTAKYFANHATHAKSPRRKIIEHSLSLNLHTVGLHFVESITGIEETPTKALVDPVPPEREERPLTDIRFRASVRGWIDKAHQSRAQTLLDMTTHE
jgi:hypothetical protein